MEVVLLIIRLLLFAILAVAGVGKLLDREGSESAVKAFGMPGPLVTTFAFLLPVTELIFGFCLLFVSFSWIGAAGALLLMVTFIGAMLIQMIKGEAPDCHCFGQIHSEPVGPRSLIRNIVVAVLPIVLLVSGRQNQGFALGDANGLIAANVILASVVVALVVGTSYVRKLTKENVALKRQLDLIEMLETGGTLMERDEAGDPTDSLPIGAPFPDFTLPDTAGKIVTFDHLIADPLPKLFLFVGPDCRPCKAMLNEFGEWTREFAGSSRFVFVSKGAAQENIERFGGELAAGMLLQKKMEFAALLHIKWTPAAILVGADGNIASHPAVGDMAIRDLVGKLRTEDFTKAGYHVKNSQKRGRVKIGEPIPEFSTSDLAGNTITRETFIGKPTLTFFLSTTCSYCGEVIDQIRKWENSADRNGTNAIVISEGEIETHRQYGLSTPIVIDDGHKLSNNLGMFGVPSAVLIDETGVIASETAVGGPMIWSLIGRKPE
ncbi:MAG: MauE/DoxX family redox-associated membrane protein [Pyrinomonadaceae bacterium]